MRIKKLNYFKLQFAQSAVPLVQCFRLASVLFKISEMQLNDNGTFHQFQFEIFVWSIRPDILQCARHTHINVFLTRLTSIDIGLWNGSLVDHNKCFGMSTFKKNCRIFAI